MPVAEHARRRTREYRILQLQRWLHAVLWQTQKLAKIDHARSKVYRQGTILDPLGQYLRGILSNELSDDYLDHHEHYFYLLSLSKLMRWADVCISLGDCDFTYFAELMIMREDCRHVRNVWEHDDEYSQGNGKTSRFLVVEDDAWADDPRELIPMDGLWLTKDSRGWLIGGRIDVIVVFKCVKKLADELIRDGVVENLFADRHILDVNYFRWASLVYSESYDADALTRLGA